MTASEFNVAVSHAVLRDDRWELRRLGTASAGNLTRLAVIRHADNLVFADLQKNKAAAELSRTELLRCFKEVV